MNRRNLAPALRRQALGLAERSSRRTGALAPRRATSVRSGRAFDGLAALRDGLRGLQARTEAQADGADTGRAPKAQQLDYLGARLNAAALALAGTAQLLAEEGPGA